MQPRIPGLFLLTTTTLTMLNIQTKLPETLVNDLSEKAKTNNVAESKIIEKAISLYLEQLSRAE